MIWQINGKIQMDTSRKLKHTCSHTLIFNNAMLLYHCPSERIFTVLHVHASLAATVIKLKKINK